MIPNVNDIADSIRHLSRLKSENIDAEIKNLEQELSRY